MFSGCSTRVGFGLTHKHKTRLERLARDEGLTLFASSSVTKKKEFVTSKRGANQGILMGSITVLLTSCLTGLELDV
jgi:hypothetical protein